MLVLSRKRGETVIAGDVRVTVVEIRGDKVRLGFVGPQHVVIDREEVYAAKLQQGRTPPEIDGEQAPSPTARMTLGEKLDLTRQPEGGRP